MARWERLEEYLYEQHDRNPRFTFTSRDYAAEVGLDAEEASSDIQAYLNAQRIRPYQASKASAPKGGAKTLFVLHRRPGTRTSSAVWTAGVRTENAISIGAGLTDDVKRRIMRAFRPDLLHIADRNPRAARRIEAQLGATIDHAIGILEVATRGGFDDGDGNAAR